MTLNVLRSMRRSEHHVIEAKKKHLPVNIMIRGKGDIQGQSCQIKNLLII